MGAPGNPMERMLAAAVSSAAFHENTRNRTVVRGGSLLHYVATDVVL